MIRIFHLRARSGVTALLILSSAALGACGFGGITDAPKVSPKEAAEIVMVALQRTDYARAYETLSTGAAGREFGSVEKLKARIEADKLQPRSWTWGDAAYKQRDDDSYVALEGTVTFSDGSPGLVRAEMEALGTQANPWRFRAFELSR